MTLFYREQAAREQSAADAADLENVRDRCQRAAEAWGKLADRLERSDALRATANTNTLARELLDPHHAEQAG